MEANLPYQTKRGYETIILKEKTTKKQHQSHLLFLSLVFFLGSCASSRDIYQNPIAPSNRIVQQTTDVSTSDAPPDWIRAVSKSFYVGTGHGKTIDEARRAALNDIKSFILSSIGETGSVSEINIVENETTGRTSNKALEAYMNRNNFKNEYKTVINISTANFEDYYWAEGAGKASYYIKYRVDEGDLEKIRQECQAAIEKHKSDQKELQKRIDSLSYINDLDVVEDLCQRKEKLMNLYNTVPFPTKYDSVKVITGIYRINQIFDNLSFRIIKDTIDRVEFVLESDGRIFRSEHTPWLSCDSDLALTEVRPSDQGWLFGYKLVPYDKKTHTIRINFEFPGLDVTKDIEIKNELLNPRVEIKEGIQFAISEYNFWNDKVLKGTIRLMLFSGSAMNLRRIEIIPVSQAGNDALISFSQPQAIVPGNNVIELVSTKIFPVQFLKSVKACDLKLYYQINGQTDFLTFESIPFNALN